ncbi:cell division protein FtsI/penicillin-binding protein 2 [Chthonomonas calidirosea]|uniref:FtsW/RodA/SpoVE family cell cycle protein n=1 Tax=Chthonomonas calidirosea TaxID=454171 RepID=UPI0006DD4C2F|nr:FtsW/RodA/SpoVE family cell cycle protein [Chthonomonas calidirosea]CEK12834.1 cell division protein FtsI/penicillin-binding protein 2 [Chthonomonas calidirosea]
MEGQQSRRRQRLIERRLSLSACVLLLCVFLLVFFARWRAEIPANALLVNQVSADTLALSLNIDLGIAQQIVAYRNTHGGFSSVNELLGIPLFPKAQWPSLAERLSASHLDWHTANTTQFAAVLHIPLFEAARLAAFRDALLAQLSPERVRHLTPSFLIAKATLLDPTTTKPSLKNYLVRRPSTVFWHFWIVAGLLCLLLFLLPPWLRNRGRVFGDPFLVPLALLLSGFGVALLFSLRDPLRDSEDYLHHAYGIFLGVVLLVLCARITPERRRQWLQRYRYLWGLGAALLLLLLWLFGRGPGGVRVTLFGFQPVEIVRLLVVFFLASYLGERAADLAQRTSPQKGWKLPSLSDLGPVVVLFGFTLVLFLVIKDLGPGLLLFGAFILMLMLTTGSNGYLWIGLILTGLGSYIAYHFRIGVFPVRVDMWLHPWRNAHPQGMQLGQALWALGSGGWSGTGLGLGMPRVLPRGEDDLAFVAWSEEAGFIGALLVLLIFYALIARGLAIARRAIHSTDRALACGLTAILIMQVLLILGGVTGLTPLTGISLPFLCYGDSALLSSFVLIGLLLGISATPRRAEEAEPLHPALLSVSKKLELGVAFLLLGVIGLGRLGQTMVVQANRFATYPIYTPDRDGVVRAHYNPRLLAIAERIPRGSIYDRQGRVLATSSSAEILKLVPDRQRAVQLIAQHSRFYPIGPCAASLIGVANPAIGGPSGLEKAYDAVLRGYNHLSDLIQDYRAKDLPGYRPRKGGDLHLTIDAALQTIAYNALAAVADKLSGKGAFVVLQPTTGDVLAAVTLPSFNPNALTPTSYHQMLAGDNGGPLFNRALDGFYPPGSTLKVATAACALDHLPNALHIVVLCNRVATVRWHVGKKVYTRIVHDDPHDPAFGAITMPEAFRVSSNIYFATLATRIGPQMFHDSLQEDMGFSHVPPLADFYADLADLGYGQGRMLASPMEMAVLAASVANEGKRMKPRLVASLKTFRPGARSEEMPPMQVGQAMTAQTAAILQGLMRSVVTNGTAAGIFNDIAEPVAGKTGTAQTGLSGAKPHSWFIGFVQPYAFACVIENGGYGRSAAAIVCRNFLRRLY